MLKFIVRTNNKSSSIAFALMTFVIIVITVFRPSPCVAENSIEIHYPLVNELITKEMSHLVAMIDTSVSPYVSVKVNDHVTPVIDMAQPVYKETLGEMVIVRLYFVPGINEVQVVGKNAEGDEVARADFKVYFRPAFDNSTTLPPSDFVESPFHISDREELCVSCHRMKVDSAVDMEPVKKFDIFCARCHESSFVGFREHGGAIWKCLYCHNYEADNKYSLYDEMGAFCGNCHGELVGSFLNVTSAHPLFRKGECLACHIGHSAEGGLLGASVNLLCFACHQPVFDGSHITPGHPLEAVKDPSREGKPMNCISCHSPHVANRKVLMKLKGGMGMCSVCHAK